MHPWVAFTSLILLWSDAVVSQKTVFGVEGQSVTLPCTYSTAREVVPMCWGRGDCSLMWCSNELIRTDGHRVTSLKNNRYSLNGIVSKGNVSLTIHNAAVSDSGLYCCRVELRGWFNDLKVNVLLQIKPAPPKVTSAPTPPKVFTSAPTTLAPTVNLKTAPSKVTRVPTPPKVFPSAPTLPAPTPKLMTAPSKVTRVPIPPKVFPSAPTLPAPTPKLMTAPSKVTRVPIPPKVFPSAPTLPAPTPKFMTAPPEVIRVPTSPKVSTSSPTMPAHMQTFKTVATSSSPVQTTETQPITPQETRETQPVTRQETSTTSSSLNTFCPTDGSSVVPQPSDHGWQYNKTHKSLTENPRRNTIDSLGIGLSIAALILLTVLAAVITKKYFCGKRKVLQISKEPQTKTSENATAVHYQAHENLYFENDLYNVPEDPAAP